MAATSNINGGGTISMHGNSVLGLQTESHDHDGCATKMKSGDTKAVMSNTKGGGSHEQGAGITDLEAKDIASNVAEIRSPNHHRSLNHHRSPNEGWSSNNNRNKNPNTDRISVSLEETMTKQPGFLVDCHNNNGQPGIQGIMHENRDVHVMADDGSWAKESEEGTQFVEHGKLDQFKVNSEMGLYGLHSP
ncbi:hypothetical protein FRX31_019197 [Thalictrum thalictroides]|uniref:Uncharacterized protein n=1 Tax=Thalictrum thalictroides TaxID=46969 RepID=A0A7J6W1E3_THATH|nr:hypothetical protein FRX31_019197 [Thalictrum thalictroides]